MGDGHAKVWSRFIGCCMGKAHFNIFKQDCIHSYEGSCHKSFTSLYNYISE